MSKQPHTDAAEPSAPVSPSFFDRFKTGTAKKVIFGTAAIAVVVVVFNVGIMVGNGTISFSQYASQNDALPDKLNYASVDAMYNALKQNYDGKLTEKDLLDGMKSGLVQAAGDPYTEYFNTKDAQKFNEQLSGSFSGIGAQLGENDDKNLIVVAPIAGSPAEQAGIKAGDVITSIDGKTTTDLSIDDAVSRIRGPKDTKVILKVIRDKSEDLSFTITRDEIKIPSVTHKILDGNIGYMQISQFSDDTTRLATEAAQEFKDKQVKGVVLDMRDDPGGLLESAVGVSSLWLPTGATVLDEKRGNQVIESYMAEGDAILKDVPTTVLINGGSASAAEIVAGALRDNDVATLVGEKSYGKGSVQKLRGFADGSQLKVTIARWYRPDGKNIDKKGIQPDKKVALSKEDALAGRDPQKDAAIQLLNEQQ